MIDIVVVDDHPVVRSGLKQFLASTGDLRVVADAGTAQEALALLDNVACGVVMLDVNLPDMNGLEALKRIKGKRPGLPVLIFSMLDEEQFAIPAINNGASGYLSKDSSPDQILVALRTVAGGGHYVGPALAEKLIGGQVENGRKLPHDTLSPREMSVMLALSKGTPLKRIAGSLGISVKTVSTFRARILAKLDLHSNADLIRYVLEHKLA